jgi:hypothetical protein
LPGANKLSATREENKEPKKEKKRRFGGVTGLALVQGRLNKKNHKHYFLGKVASQFTIQIRQQEREMRMRTRIDMKNIERRKVMNFLFPYLTKRRIRRRRI